MKNSKIKKAPRATPTSDQVDNKLEIIYLTYIVNNQGQCPPTIPTIIKGLPISTSTFNKKFAKKYGHPFYRLFIEKRMLYAAELLKAGFSGKEVTAHLGYAQPIKFNQMFRKHFGVTPKKMLKGIYNLLIPKSPHPMKNKRIPIEILREIYEHYFREQLSSPLPPLHFIAEKYSVCPVSLNKSFSDLYGHSMEEYHVQKRLEFAAELLQSNYGIRGIVKGMAFRSKADFITDFQKYFGYSPKANPS